MEKSKGWKRQKYTHNECIADHLPQVFSKSAIYIFQCKYIFYGIYNFNDN